LHRLRPFGASDAVFFENNGYGEKQAPAELCMKKLTGNFWILLGMVCFASLFFPPPANDPPNQVRVKQACLSALCLCAGCALSRKGNSK
jgi:hypothetical protein